MNHRFRAASTALLILFAGAAVSAQPTLRVDLKPAANRTLAPDFALADSAGKTAHIADYRGKVVLLDFWATWCHGCKLEIPWFVQFHRAYADKGLSVIGAAMDDEGWSVVKPFLAKTDVPYRIVTGNDALMKLYGLASLPDTFLIDKKGRIAAAYTNGLVDKENIESNIKALLAERE